MSLHPERDLQLPPSRRPARPARASLGDGHRLATQSLQPASTAATIGPVTLPTSRNQIDKLGKRLATLGRVDGSDRELFSQILDYYQSVLDDVCAILGTSNFRPTSRVKTTTTLAEKLSREHGIQLSRINDVAGARVVVEGGHLAQDAAVQGIVDLFSEEESHKPLVIDRRVDPRQGYRAVHVIIHYDGVPVEIQVRTELQDSWAQLFERLADQWGRGIRYGDKIDESTLEVWPEQSRAEIGGLLEEGLDLVMGVSKSIAHVEKARSRVEVFQAAYSGIVNVRVSAPTNGKADYWTYIQEAIWSMSSDDEDQQSY